MTVNYFEDIIHDIFGDFILGIDYKKDKRFDFTLRYIGKIQYTIHVNFRPHCSTFNIIEFTDDTELLPEDTLTSRKVWEFWIPSFYFTKLDRMIKRNDKKLLNHKTFEFLSFIFKNYSKLEPNLTQLIGTDKQMRSIWGGDCDVYGSRYKEGYTKLMGEIRRN